MHYAEGTNFSGFILSSVRDVPSIQSTAYIFSHQQTGARLLKLANIDDNKVFSIAFRTPPDDDSGLPHILEHSVLTGSRKYPTKEPFVELLKSSLNTFLNAMTFPDKTMYPVASKNEKDFLNLIDVYLDAVFFPNIYANPFTLMQEGWHYEFDQSERLIISGVVYNEMKGAFSSPERILFSKIQKLLYPTTCYAFESGGDPDAISTLSQEKFLQFHRTYYHPSNSYIYLYGNGNLEHELALISEYLADFEHKECSPLIIPQPPFTTPVDAVFEYPISRNEDPEARTFLAYATCAGQVTDPVTYLGYDIIRHLLFGTSASPLKKALLKANIGKDVLGHAEIEILQPFLCTVVKNTELAHKEKFLSIIRETLEGLVKNGIDRELIEATLNYTEFQLREAEHPSIPKGLLYHFMSMASWLYCDDPLVHLDFAATLLKIRTSVSDNFFENFIDTNILSNSHAAIVALVPKQGLAEERDKDDEKKLTAVLQKLSDKEKCAIAEMADELKRRQSEPDSPEAIATLPCLNLSDIPPQTDIIPVEFVPFRNGTILLPDIATNGIVYLHLYFDMSALETILLPFGGLLAGMMGKIRTRKHSYEDLARLINLHTGGISCYCESFSLQGTNTEFSPRLIIRGKALTHKIASLADLISEIVLESDFTDRERIIEIVKEMKSRYEMSLTDKGHMVAMKRLFSYFSPADHHDDCVSGLSFYKFLCALEKQIEKSFDETLTNLEKAQNCIIHTNELLLTITTDETCRQAAQKHFSSLMHIPISTPSSILQRSFSPDAKNEALLLGQSQVQYVAKGANFISKGFQFTGELHVLATILRLDYLWNRVRVQGGAYGAVVSLQRNGNAAFASYRDPRLTETIDVYENAASYLRSFRADRKEMTRYIIGTIATLDRHLTPREKAEKAARMHLCGITQEMLQKERDEVLACDAQKISAFAEVIEAIMRDEYLCALGNEVVLREHANLFRTLVQVMED